MHWIGGMSRVNSRLLKLNEESISVKEMKDWFREYFFISGDISQGENINGDDIK